MKVVINGKSVNIPSGAPSESKLSMSLISLTAEGWGDDNTQTVTVSGILADESAQLIFPTPALMSQKAFYSANIQCVGQAENSLTFEANKIPPIDLTVYVGIMEV